MRPEFIPPPRKGRRTVVTVELTPDEHRRMKDAAKQHNVSLRRLVREGALFALEHLGKPEGR